MGPAHSTSLSPDSPPSRAGSLPQVFEAALRPCGSGLARDEAGTFNIYVVCKTVIAGKPAPTFFCVMHGSRKSLWERGLPAMNDNAVFLKA